MKAIESNISIKKECLENIDFDLGIDFLLQEKCIDFYAKENNLSDSDIEITKRNKDSIFDFFFLQKEEVIESRKNILDGTEYPSYIIMIFRCIMTLKN